MPNARSNLLKEQKCYLPNMVSYAGTVTYTKAEDAAYYWDLTVLIATSDWDAVLETSTGTTQLAMVGYTSGTGADYEAEHDFSADGLTSLDTVVEFAAVGFDGNDWTINVMSGSGGGEGIDTYEDVPNKVWTFMYEDGVSDVDAFETAVGTTSNLVVKTGGAIGGATLNAGADDIYNATMTGGIDQEWTTISGDTVTLHFTTTASTEADCEAVITTDYLGASTGITVSADYTDGGGNPLTTANSTLAATLPLSGYCDQVGIGFKAFRDDTGLYSVVFGTDPGTFYSAQFGILGAIGAANIHHIQPAGYTASTKTLQFNVMNEGSASNAELKFMFIANFKRF